jgi:hypothetical protein
MSIVFHNHMKKVRSLEKGGFSFLLISKILYFFFEFFSAFFIYNNIYNCGWIRIKVDTLNVSDLVLTTVPIITNKNIKKICMENTMYLLSLTIKNVNFFYIHCK